MDLVRGGRRQVASIAVVLALVAGGCSQPVGASPAAAIVSAAPAPPSASPAPPTTPTERPTATAAPGATSAPTPSPMPLGASVATVPDVAPAALVGTPWVADIGDGHVVGSIGDPRRLRLPPGSLLGVSDELVVWGEVEETGASTTVHLTSRADGTEPFPVAHVAGQLLTGVRAGDAVYATGMDATSTGDPGVVAISLVDGSTRVVIPPKDVARGSGVAGRSVAVSPSGKTVISGLCADGRCGGASVIDAETGALAATLDTDAASAVSDRIALVRTGGDTTSEIAAIALKTGDELWRERANEIYHAYATDAGDAVVALSRGDGVVLERIDRDGDVRPYETLRGEPFLWPELSTVEAAVIGQGPYPGQVDADGVLQADVVDLEHWSLARNALRIDVDGNP